VKIPLHILTSESVPVAAAQSRAVERDIMAIKKGDFSAQQSLIRTFLPLILSVAQKRSSEVSQINRYVETGKAGLLKAARKYKPGMGAEKFQFLALECIQSAMDREEGGGGFFSRLFRR
jgi:DNA-directed RNA polymerase specialized sigma subunit